MKLAFISDIHGNFEALQAVMSAVDNEHVDGIYCLGDVVGYGGSPVECLNFVRDAKIPCLLGNHDEYVSSFDDSGYRKLRDDVKKSIAWTQSKLQFDDLEWFLRLKPVTTVEDCTLIHSSFSPHRWSYCMDEASFAVNFQYQKVQLAFCGHSHYPAIAIDIQPGTAPYVDNIRPGCLVPEVGKVMVNVGSVGQPRDCDPRACFVTYDTQSRELNLKRVEYDVPTAQKKIMEAGLPEIFAKRLAVGR